MSKILNLPPWVTPACTFNNTTSLPLLLLQALESVGSIKMLLRKGDTMSGAIERAQSYFLVCAVVSKTVGYIIGPKMLHDGHGDDTDTNTYSTHDHVEADGDHRSQEQIDEETSLLPERAQKARDRFGRNAKRWGGYISSFFPQGVKKELLAPFESPSADVTILCACTGAIIGLVPQLHKAFFNHYMEGGVLNAWLTSSIKNIGMLFTTLQIFIVGCKLGVSFERMKGSTDSGRIPVMAIVVIFLMRLVIWPAYVISLMVQHESVLLLIDSESVSLLSMAWPEIRTLCETIPFFGSV